MKEVLGELAIEVPTDESSFMISSEYEESFGIETAAHDVCFVVLNRVIWVILTEKELIVIGFRILPDVKLWQSSLPACLRLASRSCLVRCVSHSFCWRWCQSPTNS